MEMDFFLPYTWEDLRWWINITKGLINDIFGGRMCDARSLITKVKALP
jgi:hypothetical protein